MKLLGPLSTRPSDKRVLNLVRKGEATHDELFEAQFGEWPVRGLDKDTVCDGIVGFKGFWRDRELNPLSYIFSYSHIRNKPEDNNIYLNGLLLSPVAPVAGLAASRMFFARFHDLLDLAATEELGRFGIIFSATGLLSSYRYALLSSLVKMIAPSLSDIIGEEQIHIRQKQKNSGHMAQAAFQAAAHDWVENQPSLARHYIYAKQIVDMFLTMMPREYFAQDHELQARLHSIMVRGYPSWGKIPQNTDELYAALLDMGIKSPPIVKEYMTQPEHEELRKIFVRHSMEGYTAPPAAEMNIGLNLWRFKWQGENGIQSSGSRHPWPADATEKRLIKQSLSRNRSWDRPIHRRGRGSGS